MVAWVIARPHKPLARRDSEAAKTSSNLSRSKVNLPFGEVDAENHHAEVSAGLVGFAGAATPELSAGRIEREEILGEGGDVDETGN